MNLLVLTIVASGLFFALPNVFGEDPAVQVTLESGEAVAETVGQRVAGVLDTQGIEHKGSYLEDGRLIVRFPDEGQQLRARTSLDDNLEDDYVVAMTLAPRMPDTLRRLGMKTMNLGLDLRGGVHFLFEVDMDAAIERVMTNYEREFKTRLRRANIRYQRVEAVGDQVIVLLRDIADRDAARREMTEDNTDVEFSDIVIDGRPGLQVSLTETRLRERQDFAIEQNLTTLRNRVDELGVAEPIVQRQGLNRIV
ncbi:MAG: protein translocase subunit SecD, partial [Gammaproteobacteria bacterium]|nr:protein translocase subunit SecD [Gammaproteobacteria bacterium]